MVRQREIVDFGFDPEESPHHFAVTMGETVTIVEHFLWETDEDTPLAKEPSPRAVLDRYRWSRIESTAAEVFNRRLREAGHRPVRWKEGETLLSPYFGKELTLLIWAVEDADPTLIPNMLANWVGLVPEERWWLYSTINATSTHPDYGRDRGWRKAIKIAFAENPASVPPQSLVHEDPLPPVRPDEPLPVPASPPPRKRAGRRQPAAEQPPLPFEVEEP